MRKDTTLILQPRRQPSRKRLVQNIDFTITYKFPAESFIQSEECNNVRTHFYLFKIRAFINRLCDVGGKLKHKRGTDIRKETAG